jgi:hypothetical protein
VVVGEQEKDAGLAAHILDDDAQGLQHLSCGCCGVQSVT